MKLLLVANPLESVKIVKDTSFAMTREASRRGHRLMSCEAKDLRWQRGQPVRMRAGVRTAAQPRALPPEAG